jgi:hypothetical protein
MNRVLYREWFPQIVFNHHQPGPPGTVMFAPPFRGPVSRFVDPLIPEGIDLVSNVMHARFADEGRRGVTTRGGGDYSMWWNGGLRTTAYFHNQIGLLTEIIGSPTPTEIPLVPTRQVAGPDLALPIGPQVWHFPQSIDYAMTANRAVLDAASRLRETFLFNTYRMGKNAIERGRQSYILPSDQPDFPTATKFVKALLKAGVTVHRSPAAFRAGRRTYPAASYVVTAAQAFGPHVLDMFEPQEHAGAEEPYDITGWTLALQMGVKFDRVLEPIDAPLEVMSEAVVDGSAITGPANPAGYFLSHHQNDAFVAVNRLLRSGEGVHWPRDRTIGSHPRETGVMYVPARSTTRTILERAVSDLGISIQGVAAGPATPMFKLRVPRIGLWDRYGGSSTSGWVRWLLEQYEAPFARVYAQELDAGQLRRRYDALILTDEAVPVSAAAPLRDVPDEYRNMTGAMTWERTVPQLREFVAQGGTLILIGDSTVVAHAVGVSVSRASRESVSVPGAILQVSVDNTSPLGYGFEREVDVMFNRSPVFARPAATEPLQPSPVAWFSSKSPLRSGWARGQHYLEGTVAVLDAPVRSGRVVLLGPEVTFRAQSHATFKFLFNAIHLSAVD